MTQKLIARRNAGLPQELQLAPRLPFSITELLITFAAIVRRTLEPYYCEGNYFAVGFHIACLSTVYRLLRRFPFFRNSTVVMMRSLMICMINLMLFLALCIPPAIFLYSIFNNSGFYCANPWFSDFVDRTTCLSNQGQWKTFIVNYDSFYQSLISMYAFLDLSLWNELTIWTAVGANGPTYYIIFNLLSMVFVVGFLNLTLRGLTISLNYIHLGSSSILNKDKNVTLSPEQSELIQIEEVFCRTRLMKRSIKITSECSLLAEKVINHALYQYGYDILVVLGFTINLAT